MCLVVQVTYKFDLIVGHVATLSGAEAQDEGRVERQTVLQELTLSTCRDLLLTQVVLVSKQADLGVATYLPAFFHGFELK